MRRALTWLFGLFFKHERLSIEEAAVWLALKGHPEDGLWLMELFYEEEKEPTGTSTTLGRAGSDVD